MTVTVYRSTDAGAPQLNGLAGSLITVLDAVLVNGYGSKPAAGWTKPFSGTNKAVYRNSATLGTGTYFRVRDDAATPITGTNAVVRGYETMSDVDTGAGAFPTLSQNAETSSETPMIGKSNTASSATRSWMIVADEKSAWIIVNLFGATLQNAGYPFFIGDIKSYMVADPYCAVNGGWRSTGGLTPTYSIAGHTTTTLTNSANSAGYPKIRRDHLGNAPASAYDVFTKMAHPSQSFWGGASGFPYPYSVSNSLIYQKPIIACAGVVRGEYPAILLPLHFRPLAAGDTVEINGKTYTVIDILSSSEATYSGQFFLDLTGPW